MENLFLNYPMTSRSSAPGRRSGCRIGPPYCAGLPVRLNLHSGGLHKLLNSPHLSIWCIVFCKTLCVCVQAECMQFLLAASWFISFCAADISAHFKFCPNLEPGQLGVYQTGHLRVKYSNYENGIRSQG